MSGRRTVRGQIALDYCRANPDVADRTLARKMLEEHPKMFNSVEQGRFLIRYYRGTSGNYNRRKLKEDDCMRKTQFNPIAKSPDRTPRVLIFDIETTPILGWVWRHYDQSIYADQVEKPSRLLCWCAKWLGEDDIMFEGTKGKRSDKECCKALWKLFDEADVIVAHNGRAFDSKYMRTRWLANKMNPPSPYKQVDTLKIARGNFNFGMNKLDYLATYLGVGRKVEHEGFPLWRKCMKHDDEAWKCMEEYNIMDVLLLEEIYLELRPWDKRHPNMALFYDDNDERCINCGSKTIKELPQMSYTGVSRFRTYRCKNCGKVMRAGKQEKADKKDVLRHSL
jgi:DNA polymerase elongation subunit (family B)